MSKKNRSRKLRKSKNATVPKGEAGTNEGMRDDVELNFDRDEEYPSVQKYTEDDADDIGAPQTVSALIIGVPKLS